MNKDTKLFIVRHQSLLGAALIDRLQQDGYTNLILAASDSLDLTNTEDLRAFFRATRPEVVCLCPVDPEGIQANSSQRADFLYTNLMLQANVIHQSFLSGVRKLLFFGSTAIYPPKAPQPFKEDQLMSGPLEYSIEPYALAQIAGVKLCESYNIQYGTHFMALITATVYGPKANFDFRKGGVLPVLLRKFHLAKLLRQNKTQALIDDLGLKDFAAAQRLLNTLGIYKDKVVLWGSGTPKREFLFTEDFVDAVLFALDSIESKNLFNPKGTPLRNTHFNVATGVDLPIAQLAEQIKATVGYSGAVVFDPNQPDGHPRKLADPFKLNLLGWRCTTPLEEGLQKTYKWYLESKITSPQFN